MKLLRGAWLEGLSAIAPVAPVAARPDAPPAPRHSAAKTSAAISAKETSPGAKTPPTPTRPSPATASATPSCPCSAKKTLSSTTPSPTSPSSPAKTTPAGTPSSAASSPGLLLPGKPVRGGGRSNSTAPGAQALAIELDRLRALDPALRRRVIRAAARQLGVRLSFDETTRILTLAGLPPTGLVDPTIPTKPGSKLHLSQSLVAERTLRELRLSSTP